MDNLSVQIDDAATRSLLRGYESQLPYATSLAINKSAQLAQGAVRQEIRRVFDRPTPFAVNSTFVKFATKRKQEGSVFLKDTTSRKMSGTETRFAAQVFGGERLVKKFEAALFRVGILASGESAAPGDGADLDAYGNMTRRQIVDILRWFQASGYNNAKASYTAEQKKKRMTSTSRRRGMRYFVREKKPGRGIYIAVDTSWGSAIKPVLMFIKRPRYQPRLQMLSIVQQTVDANYSRFFRESVEQAVRTARP